jgi:RNA polymerase sigma-70 factor (ECF subfamily)
MAPDQEALFVEHRQQLFRYLCRAVGHRDLARDLTQDVFVRVARSQVPVAAPEQVRAWLFRIARNLATDHHRQRAVRGETAPVIEDTQPASQHAVLEVNEALDRLAPLDRDVFLMREVAGLGYEEIAEACELTADAVRNRLHRTRMELREWLTGPIRSRQSKSLRQRV